jgi:hypothetical protein
VQPECPEAYHTLPLMTFQACTLKLLVSGAHGRFVSRLLLFFFSPAAGLCCTSRHCSGILEKNGEEAPLEIGASQGPATKVDPEDYVKSD